MSAQILFSLALVSLAILYVLTCRIRMSKIMPLVSQAFATQESTALAMQKIRSKLFCAIPFALVTWGFVVSQVYMLMQNYQLDFVTSWGVTILLGLYGAYTLFFHTIFSMVATNQKAKANNFGQAL